MTDDRMWTRCLFRRRSTQSSRSRHKNGVISSKKDDGMSSLRAIDLVLYLNANHLSFAMIRLYVTVIILWSIIGTFHV